MNSIHKMLLLKQLVSMVWVKIAERRVLGIAFEIPPLKLNGRSLHPREWKASISIRAIHITKLRISE